MEHPPRSSERDKSGYLSEDTIAAIGTALGGALSMIRVSGPQASIALEKLTGTPVLTQFEARKLTRARLKDLRGADLDDAMAVRFVGPESFTGEDVVELHIHGGEFTASRLLETLHELGIRQALPGEFSFRAVRNGKMSLTQAQAVADLIAASNDNAVSLALEKMSGTQNHLIGSLALSLRQLAVLGEVGIDFADQDIEEVGLPHLRIRLRKLMTDLQRLHSSYERGVRVQEGIRVAFVGLPNAGKSSFFNALLGEDRSIVSELAGTTRDIVRERITLRGKSATITLRLEDTAGLRTADNPIEQIGIERSQKAAREADLVLFLIDPASSPAAVQDQWELLGRPATKTLGVFTKSDLTDANTLAALRRQYAPFELLGWTSTSARTAEGITEAIEAITQLSEKWVGRSQGEVLLTRLDHLRSVQETLEHLERAENAPEIELFAADIRQALNSLGPLIGETLPDDILGKIFSEFCIGK